MITQEIAPPVNSARLVLVKGSGEKNYCSTRTSVRE
jgi:hypothetical protein